MDCQFQIGARGFVTLAYRSEHIKSLDAAAIHQGDHFKHRRGTNAFLEYETCLADRGPLIGAFSYTRMADDGESAIVLTLDEILKIRGRSETFRALTAKVQTAEDDATRRKAQAKLDETPWVMWEDDMATKSAIKKHAKALPIAASDTFAVAAGIDEQSETGVLDLPAMADVDEVPVLKIEASANEAPVASGEAFGATARQAEPVARAAQQQPETPTAGPAPRPPAKRATGKVPAEATAPADPAASAKRVAQTPEVLQVWLHDVGGADVSRDYALQALDLARSELDEADMAAVSAAFNERWADRI